MARVMVYPLHNTTVWWRHVASQLDFATTTTVVSDLTEADVCINPGFYRALKNPRAAQIGVDAFGETGCAEIIARCRFLRVLNNDLAHRMIGAMWRSIDDTVDRHQPDLLLGPAVDRYSLDIFERVLRKRGVRYVGMAVSPVPNQIMFMAKGEYLPLREADDTEVDDAIGRMTAPGFVPSYVQAKYGWRRFARLYAHFTLRWLAFEFLLRFERNPLEHRLLSARYPACGYRVRLRDWGVMRLVDHDWRRTFDDTPHERRVFLGLQVRPEAAIDYWVNALDMIDDERHFEAAARVLTERGYRIFVKDHPSQFGFRRIEHVRRLKALPGVTIVPPEVPGAVLVNACRATVTLTGTVGLQAVLAGNAAAVAVDTYYATDDFVLIRRASDLDRLPATLDAWQHNGDLHEVQRRVMKRLMRASVPGFLNWLKWTPMNDRTALVGTTIDSLNRYAPMLVPDGPLGHRAVAAHENGPSLVPA
jgi:hypothetical protein